MSPCLYVLLHILTCRSGQPRRPRGHLADGSGTTRDKRLAAMILLCQWPYGNVWNPEAWTSPGQKWTMTRPHWLARCCNLASMIRRKWLPWTRWNGRWTGWYGFVPKMRHTPLIPHLSPIYPDFFHHFNCLDLRGTEFWTQKHPAGSWGDVSTRCSCFEDPPRHAEFGSLLCAWCGLVKGSKWNRGFTILLPGGLLQMFAWHCWTCLTDFWNVWIKKDTYWGHEPGIHKFEEMIWEQFPWCQWCQHVRQICPWGDLRERPDSHEEAAGFGSTSSSVVVVVKLVQTPFHSLVLTECSRFETLDNLVLWPFRTSFQPCNSSWWSIFPSKHEATVGWLLFYIFPHLQSLRSRGVLHEVGQAAKFLPALVGAAGIEPWEIISEGYIYIYTYTYIYIYYKYMYT